MGVHTLVVGPVPDRVDLLLIRPQYVLVAASEIGVYLTGKKRILGNVGSSGVVVERQEEQPSNTTEDAGQRNIGRKLEDAWIASQRKGRSY